MKVFFSVDLQKTVRRQWLQYLSILLLGFSILYFSYMYLFFSKVEEAALIKGNTNEKHVALTFNISWGDEKVYDILKVLKKEKVYATFFVSGEWAERHPHIIEEITEDGHELGMLGYRYKNYLEQDIEQVRKDMIYARDLFKKLGYEEVNLIRPPSGLFDEETINLANSLGLEVIHWAVASYDWENPGVDKIVNHVKKTSKGDIVLFHASDLAKQTAEALPDIINMLREKKLEFVTISQLKEGVISDESLIK